MCSHGLLRLRMNNAPTTEWYLIRIGWSFFPFSFSDDCGKRSPKLRSSFFLSIDWSVWYGEVVGIWPGWGGRRILPFSMHFPRFSLLSCVVDSLVSIQMLMKTVDLRQCEGAKIGGLMNEWDVLFYAVLMLYGKQGWWMAEFVFAEESMVCGFFFDSRYTHSAVYW